MTSITRAGFVFVLASLWFATASAGFLDDLKKAAEKIGEDTADAIIKPAEDSSTAESTEDKSAEQQDVVEESMTVQEQAVSGQQTQQDELAYMNLATYAGVYSGMATGCNDPVGPKVRADFEARLTQAPGNRQNLKRRFDQLHDTRAGWANCDGLAAARSDYESSMRAIGAEPVASSSYTQVETPPANAQSELREPNCAAPQSSAERLCCAGGRGISFCKKGGFSTPAGSQEGNTQTKVVSPTTPASAPAEPDKATSGDSNAAEDCRLSVLTRLSCPGAIKNPSSHSPELVETCKECGF